MFSLHYRHLARCSPSATFLCDAAEFCETILFFMISTLDETTDVATLRWAHNSSSVTAQGTVDTRERSHRLTGASRAADTALDRRSRERDAG